MLSCFGRIRDDDDGKPALKFWATVEAGQMARWRTEGTPGPAAGSGVGVAMPLGEGDEQTSAADLQPAGGGDCAECLQSGAYNDQGYKRFAAAGATRARNLIPGFVEAKMGAVAAPYVIAQAGLTNATMVGLGASMTAAPTATAAVIVSSADAGYFVGGTVDHAVENATGSQVLGVGAGTATGAAAGPAVGAAIGTFIFPALGIAAGAILAE